MIDLQRILTDLKIKKIDFAKQLGVHQSAITRVLKGQMNMPKVWIDHLESEYDVNLTDYDVKENLIINQKNIKKEVTQVSFDDFMEVPVIAIEAQAGYLNSIINNEIDYMKNLDTLLVPKEFESGYYAVVELNGDSMDDGTDRSLRHGDKVLCHQIQKHLWKYPLHIQTNLFVIVAADGIVLKQITKQNISTGVITCHSFNPIYNDYEVNLTDIYQLFSVKDLVRRKIKF